jgi:hypothetical protein
MRRAHFDEFFAFIFRQLLNHPLLDRAGAGRLWRYAVVLNSRNNHIRQPFR